MGLLKTIFFLLLFYYAFKFLARLFAPFLIKKAAETIQKKAAKQYKNQQPKSTVKEGETIIDKAPGNNQQSKNSVGEYVDFEEID
jgi:predicted membrane protein